MVTHIEAFTDLSRYSPGGSSDDDDSGEPMDVDSPVAQPQPGVVNPAPPTAVVPGPSRSKRRARKIEDSSESDNDIGKPDDDAPMSTWRDQSKLASGPTEKRMKLSQVRTRALSRQSVVTPAKRPAEEATSAPARNVRPRLGAAESPASRVGAVEESPAQRAGQSHGMQAIYDDMRAVTRGLVGGSHRDKINDLYYDMSSAVKINNKREFERSKKGVLNQLSDWVARRRASTALAAKGLKELAESDHNPDDKAMHGEWKDEIERDMQKANEAVRALAIKHGQ